MILNVGLGAAAALAHSRGVAQTAAKLAVRTFPDVLPDVTPGQLFSRGTNL